MCREESTNRSLCLLVSTRMRDVTYLTPSTFNPAARHLVQIVFLKVHRGVGSEKTSTIGKWIDVWDVDRRAGCEENPRQKARFLQATSAMQPWDKRGRLEWLDKKNHLVRVKAQGGYSAVNMKWDGAANGRWARWHTRARAGRLTCVHFHPFKLQRQC